jgi:hypothetical protein
VPAVTAGPISGIGRRLKKRKSFDSLEPMPNADWTNETEQIV